MLSKFYNQLSEYQKGMLLVIAGAVLLLYTFGLIQHILGFLVLACAIILVVEGIKKMKYHTQLIILFNKYTQPKR